MVKDSKVKKEKQKPKAPHTRAKGGSSRPVTEAPVGPAGPIQTRALVMNRKPARAQVAEAVAEVTAPQVLGGMALATAPPETILGCGRCGGEVLAGDAKPIFDVQPLPDMEGEFHIAFIEAACAKCSDAFRAALPRISQALRDAHEGKLEVRDRLWLPTS